MRPTHYSTKIWIWPLFLLMFGWFAQPGQAGDLVLSNNTGAASTEWFIDGESTLIMNGFDLTPLNLTLPVAIDAVSINVVEAVPGATAQVVIYTDDNGGSPQDARLAYQQGIQINQVGNVRVPLAQTAIIDAPVVWVGFYLPVGLRFSADESGSSVLTYWAWSPGTTFDLNTLSSAAVFGPSDGTSPVNIDMGGIARISAEIITQEGDTVLFGGTGENADGVPVGRQIQGGQADLSVMRPYDFCGNDLLFDPEDIDISAQAAFDMYCRADLGNFSPGVIRNANELPAEVPSYERRGFFYEVFAGGEYQADPRDSERLRVPVTHCLRPLEIQELDGAVVGIAYGAPRVWEILETVRYGDWVCAEVTHQGFISYFVPRTGNEPTVNADLYVSGLPRFVEPVTGFTDKMLCGSLLEWTYAIRNEGFVPTIASSVIIEMRSVRTGQITRSVEYPLPPVPPGETVNFLQLRFPTPTTFINEMHDIRLIVDPNNNVQELIETNNATSIGTFTVRSSSYCNN